MKLLNRTTSTVTTDTFEIDHDGRKFVYIEYLNDKGKVIDFALRNQDGEDIARYDNGSITLEKIQNFVDNHGAVC